MRKGYLDSSKGQVHFLESGQTGQKVILLHESPLSNKVFEKALPEIAKWAQVFAPDTPGYGNSDPLSPQSVMSDYAKVLVEVIEKWAAGDRVIICGVHTGASLAIEIANQMPSHCKGLFLIGVPVYSPAERDDRIANWCPDIKVTPAGEHFSWAWKRYQEIWPTAPLLYRNMAAIEMLRVSDRYNWGYQQAFLYDVMKQIKQITCPVTIAAAEGEFLFTGSKNLASELNFPFITFSGLDGQVPLRDPVLFSTALSDFADSVKTL